MNTAPGWYPDNADPRFVRWWDGTQWTPHVQPRQERVAQQVRRAGVQGVASGGGGTLLSEPNLVVPDPLRSMIVASGVTVDTVLSQNQG